MMSTVQFFQTEAERMKASGRPHQVKAAATIEKMVNILGSVRTSFAERIQSAISDPTWAHLNENGQRDRREQIRDQVLRAPYRDVLRAKLQSEDQRAELADQMPKPPALDDGDVVGFLADRELRDTFRALPTDQRDIHRIGPAMALAIARADPSATGVSPGDHEMLRNDMAEKADPETFAHLRQDNESLEWLDESARQAEAAIFDVAEFVHAGERRDWVKSISDEIATQSKKPEPASEQSNHGLPEGWVYAT